MKKHLLFILVLLLLIMSSISCSRTAMLDYIISRDDEQYREMVDKVFIALDSENKEELKNFLLKVSLKQIRILTVR